MGTRRNIDRAGDETGGKRRSSGGGWPGLLYGLLLSSVLGGCAVGPDYHRPRLNVPDHWSEPLSGNETNGPVLAAWWKGFADPELDSLIRRALQANLSLRTAQARVREARADLGLITPELWPSLDGNGSYSRNRMSANSFLPLPPGTPLDYNWYQAGFDASWELDLFGGTRRAVEAARAELAAAEFSERDVLVSLLAETARNYFEVRSAQQRLTIAQRNLVAQRNSVQLTRDRFRAGLTNELDVRQASALLAAPEADLPVLESARDAAIHRMGVLLGQPPGALATELSQPTPVPPPPPVVPVGLPSDLLLRRPDVRQAERKLAAATARIGAAKADLFPKFSLTGNAGVESVSAGDWFTAGSRFWTAGPTVTWRIFDAGRIRANVRVQDARQEEALAQYEQAALSAFEDAENALTAYAKEQSRFRALARSVEDQRAALALAQDLYKNGLADFLRVLESERALYQAEDAHAQSQKNVSVDLVSLYKALGGGWREAGGGN